MVNGKTLVEKTEELVGGEEINETQKVLEYLLIHREDVVSLTDIQRATRLSYQQIHGILSQLSERGMINYQLNTKNEEVMGYVNEFKKRLMDNFLKACQEAYHFPL